MKKSNLKQIVIILSILLGFTLSTQAANVWPLSNITGEKKGTYNLSESSYFPKTLAYIDRNYVEPERIDPKEMFKGALDEIQKSVPEILVEFASPTSFQITIDKAQKKFSSSLGSLDDLWNIMKDVFVFIELNYKGDIELKDIEAIAINGVLNTLDPHSAFLTPDYYKEFKIDTGGEFGGLGIVITSKNGKLTVITPIEDTPAWKAGIKSGDIITQIGDESTINMSLMKAVDKLRGKIGTKVAIKVERKGRAAPFELTLTRAQINIESIKSTLIKDTDGSVGYIKVKRFQKGTYSDFQKELKRLQAEAGPIFKGLIIDLRNNPGGLLDQAVDVADTFLDSGIIVSTVGANKKFIAEDVAHLKGTEPKDYPVIVLVNEGSASASEIVAGALKVHNRALVIGKKTFGKGSVQSVYEIGDNHALKLTIAQYLTGGKVSIQGLGITPDIALEETTVDKELIDVVPNKPSSEMELKKHLDQAPPVVGKNKNVINFFRPYVNEENSDELRSKEYSDVLDFKDDFMVKTATKVILAAKSAEPRKMLAEAYAVTEKLKKQEEEKISTQFSNIGTDWNNGHESSSLNLSVTSVSKQDKKIIDRAVAGKNIQLTLNVTNNGKKPLYKLIGITESENPILDEKEFAFGKVMPGQSIFRDVSIQLPASLSNRNIPYKVKFRQYDNDDTYEFSSTLKVQEIAKPSFAFNYQLEKPLTVGAPYPLPRGKNVPFTVKIKNIGDGPTINAQAYISNKKNLKDLFIETGRADLGVIRPGEIKKASFVFKVQPSMPSSTFELEITISDLELLEFTTADVEITVESGSISPQAGIWHEGPKIELAEKAFPIMTRDPKYALKGVINDDGAVKDYFIFTDEEKTTYHSNPHETNKFNIDAILNLKDGENNITIIARDNDNLTTRKSFAIQKGPF